MTTSITCYLDFISPYAYLAFETAPGVLQGTNARVTYRPVLFAGLLKHHGQLGPAEIPGKRQWTYRHVLWLAKQHHVRMDLPQAHPFNPLSLLRLALACGHDRECERHICETIFRHVWQGGAAADDPERVAQLRATLAPARDPESPVVKAELKANTDAAIAHGVFGVPSFVVGGHLFWGLDSLPIMRGYLDGDPWFDGPWSDAAKVIQGVVRSRT